MIEKSLAIISNKTRRGSLALRNDLRNSFRVERVLERNSLKLKSKLVEERDRTLKALALRSREQEKDKKGGVGGALSILGGGALGRRFFGRGGQGGLLRRFPKVPKSPSSLLRMQKGTSALSRVGRVGRFGKIGPLAILGTGLDFVDRKAQGQTNLQAGLGAGGGLAGALAGAKYGAILGTAIGGPIGTVIGGIGGGIIGGLAGGRLADIFSGADRRRKFEEQRVIISTQKTLFSSALDDLDKVLDKLEISSPFLVIRRDDDELPEGRSPYIFTPVRPIKPQPGGREFAKEFAKYMAIAGLVLLLIPTDFSDLATTAPAAIKLKALFKTTKLYKVFQALFAKPEVFLKPGKQIPAISEKGLRIRADSFLRRLNPRIKLDKVDKIKKIKPKSDADKTLEILNKEIDRLSKKLKEITNSKTLDEAEKKARTKILLEKVFEKNDKIRQIQKKLSPNIESTVKPGGTNLSFDSESTTESDNIALAPTNNIFLINQENSTSSTPQTQGGTTTVLIGGGTMDSFDAEINIRQMEILQTA